MQSTPTLGFVEMLSVEFPFKVSPTVMGLIYTGDTGDAGEMSPAFSKWSINFILTSFLYDSPQPPDPPQPVHRHGLPHQLMDKSSGSGNITDPLLKNATQFLKAIWRLSTDQFLRL